MGVLSAGERGGQRYVPIGNENKPLPEGEEKGLEEETPCSTYALKGWWD